MCVVAALQQVTEAPILKNAAKLLQTERNGKKTQTKI